MTVDLSFSTGLNSAFSLYFLCELVEWLIIPFTWCTVPYFLFPCSLLSTASCANNVYFSFRQSFVSTDFAFYFMKMLRPFFN